MTHTGEQTARDEAVTANIEDVAAHYREMRDRARRVAVDVARELLNDRSVTPGRRVADGILEPLQQRTFRLPERLCEDFRDLPGSMTRNLEAAMRLYLLLMTDEDGVYRG